MWEEMVKKNMRIEDWLFDKTLWVLLEFGEVEETFYVLSLKKAYSHQNSGHSGLRLSGALWGALLDAAAQKRLVRTTSLQFTSSIQAKNAQHDGVNLIWSSQVQTGYLKPATGTCLSVLALASWHGHVSLATDVFRVLTERETVFTTHHYELLIITYLNANDLSAALSVLLIMADANLKIDTGTCQPLYWHLCKTTAKEENRPMAAFSILQEHEAAGRKVPTAAINACIQASISLQQFEEAIEFYKALHTVSHSGPDTQTFNILFRGCYMNTRKELAMFFANEMIQLGLKPDRLTYDRLILVCLQADDIEDALLYYEEMRTVKVRLGSQETLKPRRGTWEALISRCVVRGDDRAVALLKDYQQGTSEPRKNIELAVKSQFEESSSTVETGSEGTQII
jgi:hypothetical protein